MPSEIPSDVTVAALAYMTACLDEESSLHADLFVELANTHDNAARLAIGLANVATLLCQELGIRTGRGERLVLQDLAVAVQRERELG